MTAPRYVALCGAPESGKSTVADIMVRRYGAVLVDDGAPLRAAASAFWGLSHDDVHTQSGKARRRVVCGKSYTHRELLGHLATLLTSKFGAGLMAEIALESIPPNSKVPLYVFGSVRTEQGAVYRARGGIVVEIARPGKRVVHAFDAWNPDYVTHRLDNDGDLDALEAAVAAQFDSVFEARTVA